MENETWQVIGMAAFWLVVWVCAAYFASISFFPPGNVEYEQGSIAILHGVRVIARRIVGTQIVERPVTKGKTTRWVSVPAYIAETFKVEEL